MKKCEYCGELFEPDHANRKYHSECAVKKQKEQNRERQQQHPEEYRKANRKQYEKLFSKEAVKERRKEIFCSMTGMSREQYLKIKKEWGMV